MIESYGWMKKSATPEETLVKRPTGLLRSPCGGQLWAGEGADEMCPPEDIGTSQHSVELAEELVAVVHRQALLQDGQRQSGILNDERVQPDGRIVDVAEGHRQGVDEEVERIVRVEPAKKTVS